MQIISASYFKLHFDEIIKQMKSGVSFKITSDDENDVIGYLSSEAVQPVKRKLGILEGKASFIFHDDFQMTTEEFLGLGDERT